MTARVLDTLAAVAVLVAIVVGGYVLSRRKSEQVRPGVPDRVTDDLVSGLVTENRKWQAEAAYWKAAAERLQREIDRR